MAAVRTGFRSTVPTTGSEIAPNTSLPVTLLSKKEIEVGVILQARFVAVVADVVAVFSNGNSPVREPAKR